MNTLEKSTDFAHTLIGRFMLLVVGTAATFFSGAAISLQTSAPLSSDSQTHMSEALRTAIKKVIVLPGTSPTDQTTIGSYGKATPGLVDGMQQGSEIGRGVSTEIAGIPFSIPFPFLTLPGALIGGMSGAAKRELQEFRDALTADLAQAAGPPLSNDALASDVFWGLQNIPNLDSKVFALTTPIPRDTDAILYVSLTAVTIDVQGKDAIITTLASMTLRRLSDGKNIFANVIKYEDRDTLSNWTKNENAAWHDYANFARHYIGREISAEVFERIEFQHELQPQPTDTVARIKKNAWQGVSRSLTPTLAWELKLQGSDIYSSWAKAIKAGDISYDVDIYDMHRLVYSAKHVPDPRHTVVVELEKCKTYRWTVRPSYQVGSDTRFGEWMRIKTDTGAGNGNVGTKASVAPAYIQDFASLAIKC
ncbi:MAG: hypothetical protein IIA08_06070 [Proteobacteria bacterium]|nr:hypothetical protein [Pseudomonadota bacterium]